LQASSEVVNKSVMDKTGDETHLELVMFESDVNDTQHSDVSPTSDIQVCIHYFIRLHFAVCFKYKLCSSIV